MTVAVCHQRLGTIPRQAGVRFFGIALAVLKVLCQPRNRGIGKQVRNLDLQPGTIEDLLLDDDAVQ
ncbi:hypothetical protein D3C71_1368070 [compost metagenome]